MRADSDRTRYVFDMSSIFSSNLISFHLTKLCLSLSFTFLELVIRTIRLRAPSPLSLLQF